MKKARLSKVDEIDSNPYIGWASDAGDLSIKQPHSLVFANVSWKELEPEKGKFSFESFENSIHYPIWKSRDVKIILRIYMDYPEKESHIDIPEWLYDEIGHDGTFYSNSYGKGFSPNYSNSTLITYHDELIRAMAQRYDNDPEIAFVEIGSIGHWGEWHTNLGSSATPFPDSSITDQYVNQYIKYFKSIKLMVRRPLNIAKKNHLGLFNDSFGDVKQTDDYFITWFTQGYKDHMTGEQQPEMDDFWKYAPSGGEVANYPGMQYFEDSCIKTTLRQLEQSHTSWLGPSAPIYYGMNVQSEANLDKVRQAMGYKFYLNSVLAPVSIKKGESLPFTMTVKNVGIAPFYYKWKFEVSLTQSGKVYVKKNCTDDITAWLPDAEHRIMGTLQVPASLPDGQYQLCYSIIDPSTGQPGVKFADGNRLEDGRYVAAVVTVSSK